MTTEETGVTAEADDPVAMEPEAPAGFWVRAGAAFIDGLAVMACAAAAAVVVTKVVADADAAGRVLQLATVLIGASYYTVLTGFAGQTVGKMAAGVRVVRADGLAVSYPRALGRWAAYSLSSLPIGLGFAAAAFTKRKRALHDVVAGTRVVYVPGVGKGRKAVMAGLGAVFAVSLAGLVALSLTEAERPGERTRKEASAVGGVRALRAMVGIYKAQKGKAPADLGQLTELTDFTGLPELELPDHAPTKDAETISGAAPGGTPAPEKLKDTGRWGYDPESGAVFIDCTHLDSEANRWWEY